MAASVDENLQNVLTVFAQHQQISAEERQTNGPIPWLRPPTTEWSGDLQTENALVEIHNAFNTDQAEEALKENFNVSKASESAPFVGNNGTSVLCCLQIDYMAQAERAYRARVSNSFIRSLAHVTAREQGHGKSDGVFTGQVIGYFSDLVNQSSS